MPDIKAIFQLSFVLLAVILFSACATLPGTRVAEDVAPQMVEHELTDNELLNVSITVFDPGELPDDEDKRWGLSKEIRAAEANFIPVHLKYTLQRSGFWGAVRVIPEETENSELLISGKIAYSDGESLSLSIEVVDARNIVWFKKTYAETSLPEEHTEVEPEKKDTFQDLFNTIANDLVEFRQKLTLDDLQKIHQLAELRYAASMAPESFEHYFSKDKKDHFMITSLPARNDPMLGRLRAIQSRDEMMMDTLTSFYDNYYFQLWDPYQNWRQFRADEMKTIKEIKSQALTRQLLGVAAIIGAVAVGIKGDYSTVRGTDALRNVLVVGGAAAIVSGYQKRKEAEMNKEVIEELGESFTSEAKPLVIDVNGETIRLTGTAQEQYREWRQILKDIYLSETGLNGDLPTIIGQEEEIEPQDLQKSSVLEDQQETTPLTESDYE